MMILNNNYKTPETKYIDTLHEMTKDELILLYLETGADAQMLFKLVQKQEEKLLALETIVMEQAITGNEAFYPLVGILSDGVVQMLNTDKDVD